MEIVACEMMEDEIKLAIKRADVNCNVRWLERGLHNSPDRLRHACQIEIDRTPASETLLLAFSQCGNATVGLRCNCAKLVIPKFADCIRIALSGQKGCFNEADMRTLYTSKGWMDSNHSMRADYELSLKKFGEKKTAKIFRRMLEQYKYFCLMETGAYDMRLYQQKAQETAALFGLESKTCQGYLRVYEKLFAQQWDEEFVVKLAGETVLQEDF